MPSISANQIKLIKSLSDKKYRDKYGLFVVEGEKLVAEAEASDFKIEEVFYKEEIGEKAMERISSLSSPSPVLAVVRKRECRYGGNGQLTAGLYLALDGIKDPGNMGTMIRLADWFGIKTVYAADGSVDIYNPKVVQATMGALFRTDFMYTDLTDLCSRTAAGGGTVYGTFLSGRNIYESDLETGAVSPVMIVIGNESDGISDRVASVVSERISIPSFHEGRPGAESLNAAVAAAVTVSEFRRRTI